MQTQQLVKNSIAAMEYESENVFKFLKSIRSSVPGLTPDYTHIFRGRGKDVSKMKDILNLRWKAFDENWAVASGTYRVKQGNISSWTYNEVAAWRFTGMASSSIMSRKSLESKS